MKKNESKYFYSAELMNQALLELLEKKDIEFITVTEVAKKAGVNRSTFYLHYDNVYELLEEVIDCLNREFIGSFERKSPPNINSKDDAFLVTENQLVPYLEFCKKHKRVLRLVYQKPHLFQKNLVKKRMYDKVFYPAISQFIKEETKKVYLLEFFTEGVVGIIHKWIDLDCVTPIDEIVEIIKNCVGYSAV